MKDQPTGSGSRVLLVDDDAELCELVTQYLTSRGFVVETSTDGETGLARAQSGGYALLILDVMLPGIDGFEVLRRLRSGPAARLPVVMLTAHGDEVDRIVGLELGADDYLGKPFNPRELLARIQAILRRANVTSETPAATSPVVTPDEEVSDYLQVGDVEINPAARSVRCAGEVVDLTAVEFDLLHVLLRSAGRVALRDDLSREALQRKLLPFDRSLDMHISKLRRKIGVGPDGCERIKTLRGVGYIYLKDTQ